MKQRLLTVTLAALVLCGCGGTHSASANEADYYYEPAGGTGNYMAAPSYDAKEGNTEEYAADSGAAQNTEDPVSVDPVLSQEKLVYTGDLRIQSLQYEESLANLRGKVRELGGIIEHENESDSNYRWYDGDYTGSRSLYMTVRIPTENFEAFMNASDGIGKVISRSSGVQNISRQYNDTTVQIEALEKQQERLLAMMDKAETIEDMIMVEQRLTEVQSQLNSLQTFRQSMDTDVMYSTVTVSLEEVKEYVHVNESFLERIGNAFVSGWKNFVWNMEDFLIDILYVLPYLLIAGLVIWFLRRKNLLHMPKFSWLRRLFSRKKDNAAENGEES